MPPKKTASCGIVLAGDDAPGDVLPRAGIRRRTRRVAAAMTGAVALALMTVGALALAHIGGGPARSPSREASRSAQLPPLTVRLAGYRFTLPAGFAIVAHPCAPGPAQRNGRFAAAASAKSGCIEVFLTAGPAAQIPGNAQAIRIEPYRAFALHGPQSSVRLYVKMPALNGRHALVLVARRLTLSQVVAIATAGLPAKIGSGSPCANGCG